jgi:pimeloyl-ACP methyl ester carboxylesterase
VKRRRFLAAFPILAAGAVVASVVASPAREYIAPACWADIPGMLPMKHAATPYTLTDFVLHSKHVAEPVKYTIASPAIVFDPVAHKGANVPSVVLCLPGRAGTGRSVFDDLRLHEVAAEVVPPTQHVLFVGVDSGETYWHERANGEDRMTMLLDELVPFVQKTFDARVRATMGWSMGGFGALVAMSRRPDLFASAAVASPDVFLDYATMERRVPDAFDAARDFIANDLVRDPAGLAGKPMWIACGEGDPFVHAARAFAPPRATVTRVIVPGCHDEGFWRLHLAEQTRYIANALV